MKLGFFRSIKETLYLTDEMVNEWRDDEEDNKT